MFADLISRRRVVQHRGRRYTVLAPTLATLWTFLDRYGGALAGLESGFRDDPALVPSSEACAQALLLGVLLADLDGAEEVLGTCTEDDPEDAAVPDCVRAMVSLLAVLSVARSLQRSYRRSSGMGEDGLFLVSVELAERFGVSPMEVANGWPLAAVVALTEVRRDQGSAIKATPLSMASIPGFAGIGVKKRPLVN
jgi:hypothetical protein